METDKLTLPTASERIYDGYGTTLLAIIVPPEFCPQFQEIRTKHITPVNCGPHITLYVVTILNSLIIKIASFLFVRTFRFRTRKINGCAQIFSSIQN